MQGWREKQEVSTTLEAQMDRLVAVGGGRRVGHDLTTGVRAVTSAACLLFCSFAPLGKGYQTLTFYHRWFNCCVVSAGRPRLFGGLRR